MDVWVHYFPAWAKPYLHPVLSQNGRPAGLLNPIGGNLMNRLGHAVDFFSLFNSIFRISVQGGYYHG